METTPLLLRVGNRTRRAALVTAAVMLSACALLVGFAAVSTPVATEMMLALSNAPGVDDPKKQHSLAQMKAPSHEDVAEYLPRAAAVLNSVGIKIDEVLSTTDLQEGCGQLLYPCLATVGECVHSKLIDAKDHHISNNPRACQCFIRGLVSPLEIASRPGLQLSCSYQCLESIKGAFQAHIGKKNGLYGEDLRCDSQFDDMARTLYGGRNDEINTQADVDALSMAPLEDPKVETAGNALLAFINTHRVLHCPAKHVYGGPPQILYATHGYAGGGKSQYRLEILLGGRGGEVYKGRVVHLPKDEQLTEGFSHEGQNLLGRFVATTMHPDPCGDGEGLQLATSHAHAKSVNAQKLSWRAVASSGGRTLASLGTGFKPLSDDERVSRTVWLKTDGLQPPSAYDARDVNQGEAQCAAFNILNQGSCGSCYAFAAASAYSARLCRASERNWNVVVSPQELMDCSNGCDGGNPMHVYSNMLARPVVAAWCDPYQQRKDVCGKVCSDGVHFTALEETTHIIGGFSEGASKAVKDKAVEQMKLELLQVNLIALIKREKKKKIEGKTD